MIRNHTSKNFSPVAEKEGNEDDPKTTMMPSTATTPVSPAAAPAATEESKISEVNMENASSVPSEANLEVEAIDPDIPINSKKSMASQMESPIPSDETPTTPTAVTPTTPSPVSTPKVSAADRKEQVSALSLGNLRAEFKKLGAKPPLGGKAALQKALIKLLEACT